jgi:hypothetical protein
VTNCKAPSGHDRVVVINESEGMLKETVMSHFNVL